MKLVTFAVSSPVGSVNRLGVLLDGHEHGRVVDLTASYGAYLAAETDEPTPTELAALRTPPDMIGWLRGAHKSREAADQAVDFVRRHTSGEGDLPSIDGVRLAYHRSEVRLLAPLPRPRTIRDYSI